MHRANCACRLPVIPGILPIIFLNFQLPLRIEHIQLLLNLNYEHSHKTESYRQKD